MEQEKEWYQDELDRLTLEIERGEIGGGTADYKIESLIKAATLHGIQQGKREAWEEIGKMVEENNNQTYQLHEVLAALRWNVKAKLASLDNSSKG